MTFFLDFKFFSNLETKKYYRCSEKKACSEPDSKITFTYGSWTKKYKLYCDRAGIRESGKSLFFVMNTVGCFTILNLIDRVGRKLTGWICSIVIISSLALSSVLDNWYIRMICMGLANGCEGCFSNLFNVLMNETSCKSKKIKSRSFIEIPLQSSIFTLSPAHFRIKIRSIEIGLWKFQRKFSY